MPQVIRARLTTGFRTNPLTTSIEPCWAEQPEAGGIMGHVDTPNVVVATDNLVRVSFLPIEFPYDDRHDRCDKRCQTAYTQWKS